MARVHNGVTATGRYHNGVQLTQEYHNGVLVFTSTVTEVLSGVVNTAFQLPLAEHTYRGMPVWVIGYNTQGGTAMLALTGNYPKLGLFDSMTPQGGSTFLVGNATYTYMTASKYLPEMSTWTWPSSNAWAGAVGQTRSISMVYTP